MTNRGSFLRKSISYAAILTALSLAPSAANAARCFGKEVATAKAGNATAVRGPEIGLKKSDGAEFSRPAAGDDVYGGDRIRTGDDSILQLKLCDWSTYTFSPRSESDINEFYAADGAQRRRVVNFVRGGLRLLSGRETGPDDTEVRFEEAGVTMGVRGTGVVIVELDGLIYILLEGPGLDNSGLANPGRVDFTDEERNEILAKLTRAGFAVAIGPDGVSEPFMPDAALLRRIYAAFAPSFLDSDDSDTPPPGGGGSPEDDSGQSAQQGGEGANYTQGNSDAENFTTEIEPPFTPPFTPQGQMLTIGELDTFGSIFVAPSGHFLAVGPAQLFSSRGGQPRQLATNGIAIMQMHVDFSTRIIAPEAARSFTIFDFTVIDPNDLSIDNPAPVQVGGDATEDAYHLAQLANVNAPFDSGLAGFANFLLPIYRLTIRQGAQPGQVTLDADIAFVGPDDQGVVVSADAMFRDLIIIPGDGDLVFFSSDNFEFAEIFSIPELNAFAASGQAKYAGFGDFAVNTLGNPSILPGFSYSEFMVDFASRTIGGPGSFFFITASANPLIGGVQRTAFVPFNTAIPWSAGVFNMAIVPLAGATNDPNFVAGEFVAAETDPGIFGGLVAAILRAGGGVHLYSIVDDLFDITQDNPLSTVAELDSLVLAVGVFHFNSGQFPGVAEFTTAGGVSAFGSADALIDIDFGNRTLGGGGSAVSVSINDATQGVFVNFQEMLNTISFDRAAGGLALFGLDRGDFSGANIDAALLLLRTTNDPTLGAQPAGEALLNFSFTVGGGEGKGKVGPAPRIPGASPLP